MGASGRIAAIGIMTSLLAAGLGVAAPDSGAAVASAASGPREVRAPYADLTDADTGAVMWSRSATANVPMGSIAKVMTAYVVIQEGNLDRLITVPRGITGYDKGYGASVAGLKPGERLTARQLLYAMLVSSGCDAAYTLATAYGPGPSAFVGKMNATAARLGLPHTVFTDVSGLPKPTGTSTYSDARDLVSLGRAAMGLPLLASIVRLARYRLPAESGRHPAFVWKTTNPLIGHYAGVTGIKTGNTQAAGFCLLFEARRNGRTLIGVVLDDPTLKATASDAERMMDWGWTSSVHPANRPLVFW